MTKPRLFLLAFAACLGVAVFWGVRLLPPRHRINPESFEKIQVGMTLEEVEAILGVPPGDYATKQHVYDLWGGDGVVLGLRHRIGWVGDEGAIHVILNPEGSVSHKLWLDLWFIGEVTFLDKLRGWFGLRQKMNAVSSYPMPPDW